MLDRKKNKEKTLQDKRELASYSSKELMYSEIERIAQGSAERAAKSINKIKYINIIDVEELNYFLFISCKNYQLDKIDFDNKLNDKITVIYRKNMLKSLQDFASHLRDAPDGILLEFSSLSDNKILLFDLIDNIRPIIDLAPVKLDFAARRGARNITHIKNLIFRLIELYVNILGNEFSKNFRRYKDENGADTFESRGTYFVLEVARAIDGDIDIEEVETAMKGWRPRRSKK